MRALIVLLCVVALSHGWSLSQFYYDVMPPITDESCGFTRQDAAKCLAKYVDVAPRDGGISPKEVRLAIKSYSSAPIRALFWGLGTKQIYKACDADHNGRITMKDWFKTSKTCLPFKRNMCSLEWFCKRAEKMYKSPRV